MKKSIIVLDTPQCCGECLFSKEGIYWNIIEDIDNLRLFKEIKKMYS